MPAPPVAHETWFVPNGHGLDWSFAGEALTLALLAAALLAALAVRLVAHAFNGVDVPFLRSLDALADRYPGDRPSAPAAG